MGYTTYFDGAFEFNKPVTDELRNYINKFSGTRRMLRDNNKIKELFPDWRELCFNGELGKNGEYFVNDDGHYGQTMDDSIIDYNRAGNQPGLWCQWIINDNNELVWDEGEKFYNYVEWLEYLIKHFFAPSGYVLNGTVFYEGEDSCDFGKIIVTDNVVKIAYGHRVYDEVIQMRDVIVVFEVDDDKAIKAGLGTIDYLERELAHLADSGLKLQNARILDYDDEHDAKAIVLANRIFKED